MYKRLVIILIMIGGLGIFSQVSAQTIQKKKITKVATLKTDSIQGALLISKSDCLSCHKPKIKLIGPSFLDIAKKYPATDKNYLMLAEKVIKGGSGNWGPMAMSPHNNITPADAKKMIVYILATG